jgi:hypothetical protein
MLVGEGYFECGEVDPAQVAWVVANYHLLWHADPGTQHIRSVRHRMQRYALAAHQPVLDGQRVDEKPMGSGGELIRTDGSGNSRFLPSVQ